MTVNWSELSVACQMIPWTMTSFITYLKQMTREGSLRLKSPLKWASMEFLWTLKWLRIPNSTPTLCHVWDELQKVDTRFVTILKILCFCGSRTSAYPYPRPGLEKTLEYRPCSFPGSTLSIHKFVYLTISIFQFPIMHCVCLPNFA